MALHGLRVDRSSPVPLYDQLGRQLEAAIATGELAKGDFLDNELVLADVWRVSRPTVRRAIQELVDAGTLVRRRGVGTQVVNAPMRRAVKLTSLYDDLAISGRAPRTDVVTLTTVAADRETADALGVRRGDGVLYLERRRSAGRTPLAIMKNFLVAEVAEGLTREALESAGLYELLRMRGVRPRIAHQVIGARAASDDEAAALRVAVGAPLLTMRRIMQDDLGRTVELGNHAYDAAKYSVETTVVDT